MKGVDKYTSNTMYYLCTSSSAEHAYQTIVGVYMYILVKWNTPCVNPLGTKCILICVSSHDLNDAQW